MNESETMSTQPVAPAKLVQAKQTITKNDDTKFVSIVRGVRQNSSGLQFSRGFRTRCIWAYISGGTALINTRFSGFQSDPIAAEVR
jgi:hypothetical protein